MARETWPALLVEDLRVVVVCVDSVVLHTVSFARRFRVRTFITPAGNTGKAIVRHSSGLLGVPDRHGEHTWPFLWRQKYSAIMSRGER
jgi:hypothetical protein